MERTPPLSAFLPIIIILTAAGGGGLLIMMSTVDPLLGYRMSFFFLVVLLFAGLALPLSVLLNLRFPSSPPVGPNVVVRQALWVGVYVATLAWLYVGRVFGVSLAVIFFIGFTAIELFWRLWERSQWRQR